jgi:hypothetical protein
MAQRVIRELVDDLTGDRADETITFGIDGKWYEMDLSSNNAGILRDIFGDYVKAARKVPASGRRSRTTSAAPRANRAQMRAIREWAKSQGLQVSDRGRMSQEIRDKFNAAHGAAA